MGEFLVSPEMIGLSFIVLGFFLIIGKWIRIYSPILQDLYLPTSVIAGVLALLFGPEILGRLIDFFNINLPILNDGVINPEIFEVWSSIPGLFINIVFAGLFLGKTIPSIKKVWIIGGPQVVMGQTVSWGQYVVGLLLVVFILTPLVRWQVH